MLLLIIVPRVPTVPSDVTCGWKARPIYLFSQCHSVYCTKDGDCSLVRRFCSPKVRKSEIKGSSFRRFCSPITTFKAFCSKASRMYVSTSALLSCYERVFITKKIAYFMISEFWTFGLQNLFVRTREPFFSNL